MASSDDEKSEDEAGEFDKPLPTPEDKAEDADEPSEDDAGSEGSDDDGTDDDGADDDGSDDDTDDDGSDDSEEEEETSDDDDDDDDDDEEDDDDEDDEDEERPKRRKRKGRSRKGMTPGERLAAAKARKARRKQTKRGRDAEVVESEVLKRADAAGEWVRDNRKTIWLGLIAIVAVVVAGVAWSIHRTGQEEAASTLLWEAVQASRAEIRPEGSIDPDDEDDGRETFTDARSRAETALDRYRKVLSDYPQTEAAVWARLGEANSLMALGQAEEAREAFQQALAEGGDDSMVEWRAIEGIAFSYESDEEWDQALDRFQELGESSEGDYRDIADYHIARMHLAKNDEVRAKEVLRTLVERLRTEREDDEPELSYVLSQAEIRLMEIDSSLVQREASPGGFGGPGGPGGALTIPSPNEPGGGGAGDLSPEQMQKLLKMLEQRGFDGSGGGPPGGGPPPGPPPGGPPPSAPPPEGGE